MKIVSVLTFLPSLAVTAHPVLLSSLASSPRLLQELSEVCLNATEVLAADEKFHIANETKFAQTADLEATCETTENLVTCETDASKFYYSTIVE
jgi:hypothetical protein